MTDRGFNDRPSDQLRLAREQIGLSQVKLALTGLSRNQIVWEGRDPTKEGLVPYK
jgi:hypothetical protein